MPIYAYRCESCGFADDVLQKLSDPVLTDCPECGKSTFRKQVTAAGFQLKGSGWYVTDFREGGSNTGKAADTAKAKPTAGNDAGNEANNAAGNNATADAAAPKADAKSDASGSAPKTAPAAPAPAAPAPSVATPGANKPS